MMEHKYSKLDVSKMGFLPVEQAYVKSGESYAICPSICDKIAKESVKPYYQLNQGFSKEWSNDNRELINASYDYTPVIPDGNILQINGVLEPANYQKRTCIVPGCTKTLYAHREGEIFCWCHSCQWHEIKHFVYEDNRRLIVSRINTVAPIINKQLRLNL